MNGNQIRSTSPFDMPLRSASTTAARAAPTRSQSARSRSLPKATAVAAPRASAKRRQIDDDEREVRACRGDARAVACTCRRETGEPPETRGRERDDDERASHECRSGAAGSSGADRHGNGNDGDEDESVRTECGNAQEHAASRRRDVAEPVATRRGDDHEGSTPRRHCPCTARRRWLPSRSRWA